jgi:small-conductance mechanosensitive channel
MEMLQEILEFELFSVGEHSLRVVTVLLALLIVAVTRVILLIVKKSLLRKSKSEQFNEGNSYALYQIIKYFVWVIAIGLVLETLGVKVTLLLAGSAALLVGVGLGLQQTFNDIISGIILLSERSIKIGDILEIDDDIVRIQEIGLRTSKGLNRDDISIIIPNSLITSNKVINWSHQSKQNRFRIEVGVAYGSDVEFIIKILEDSAREHFEVDKDKDVEARLVGFGNSSLDFQVLFYSEVIFGAERMKSDVRRIISKNFEKNGVTIPFPQMDVHLKSDKKDA